MSNDAEPNNYTITVILSPANLKVPTRRLALRAGEPVVIGRASSSEDKGRLASPKNAFFECPVVSREHAELSANPWTVHDEQVTIMDRGSMHGTFVNGSRLGKGERVVLRSGDNVRLGNKVHRGYRIHTAFDFTYHRVSGPSTTEYLDQSSSGGFHVSVPSDEGSSDEDLVNNDDETALGVMETSTSASSQPSSEVGNEDRAIESDARPSIHRDRSIINTTETLTAHTKNQKSVIESLERSMNSTSSITIPATSSTAPPMAKLGGEDDCVVEDSLACLPKTHEAAESLSRSKDLKGSSLHGDFRDNLGNLPISVSFEDFVTTPIADDDGPEVLSSKQSLAPMHQDPTTDDVMQTVSGSFRSSFEGSVQGSTSSQAKQLRYDPVRGSPNPSSEQQNWNALVNPYNEASQDFRTFLNESSTDRYEDVLGGRDLPPNHLRLLESEPIPNADAVTTQPGATSPPISPSVLSMSHRSVIPTPKTRISINDIVDSSDVGSVRGTKRKAEVLHVTPANMGPYGPTITHVGDPAHQSNDGQPVSDVSKPPAKKARRLLNYLATGAGGVVIGSAGTFAFLASPLSENLLTWLA